MGNSYVYKKMNGCGAVLGGEQSGHVIFGKLESTGDGLVTAIMIMEAMAERDTTLSELVRGFKKKPQLTVSIKVRNKAVALDSPAAVKAVENAEKRLKGRGRLLVRASGTEDVVRVTVESPTADECDEVCREIETALKKGEEEE